MYKQPKFWREKNSKISIFLLPISMIYYFFFSIVTKLKKEKKIPLPTICVGNIVIGGTGKTPLTIALRKILSKKFNNIFVLTRGYGGSLSHAKIVDNKDDASSVGDEAMIHAEEGFTCVSKNRIDGAHLCLQENADLLILDDGLQSKHIKKDLSFILIDSIYQLGNERIFPSGPLRESLQSGIQKADAIFLIGNKKIIFDINCLRNKPIFYAKKIVKIPKIKSKNVYAFCGIGFPENFFDALNTKGLNIVKKKKFGDHHTYKDREIEEIIDFSKNRKLEILTTKKDIIKIDHKFWKYINVVDLKIKVESEKKILDFCLRKIKSNQNSHLK